MTNQQHNPDQLRDRASQNQQQLLEQYSSLIAENVTGQRFKRLMIALLITR